MPRQSTSTSRKEVPIERMDLEEVNNAITTILRRLRSKYKRGRQGRFHCDDGGRGRREVFIGSSQVKSKGHPDFHKLGSVRSLVSIRVNHLHVD